LRKTWFDAEELIREGWATLESMRAGRVVDFRIESGGRCYGDRSVLKHVFVNLLSNAARFTSGRDHGKIVIKHTVAAMKDVFAITDNGAGFDERHATRMFRLFRTKGCQARAQVSPWYDARSSVMAAEYGQREKSTAARLFTSRCRGL